MVIFTKPKINTDVQLIMEDEQYLEFSPPSTPTKELKLSKIEHFTFYSSLDVSIYTIKNSTDCIKVIFSRTKNKYIHIFDTKSYILFIPINCLNGIFLKTNTYNNYYFTHKKYPRDYYLISSFEFTNKKYSGKRSRNDIYKKISKKMNTYKNKIIIMKGKQNKMKVEKYILRPPPLKRSSHIPSPIKQYRFPKDFIYYCKSCIIDGELVPVFTKIISEKIIEKNKKIILVLLLSIQRNSYIFINFLRIKIALYILEHYFKINVPLRSIRNYEYY